MSDYGGYGGDESVSEARGYGGRDDGGYGGGGSDSPAAGGESVDRSGSYSGGSYGGYGGTSDTSAAGDQSGAPGDASGAAYGGAGQDAATAGVDESGTPGGLTGDPSGAGGGPTDTGGTSTTADADTTGLAGADRSLDVGDRGLLDFLQSDAFRNAFDTSQAATQAAEGARVAAPTGTGPAPATTPGGGVGIDPLAAPGTGDPLGLGDPTLSGTPQIVGTGPGAAQNISLTDPARAIGAITTGGLVGQPAAVREPPAAGGQMPNYLSTSPTPIGQTGSTASAADPGMFDSTPLAQKPSAFGTLQGGIGPFDKPTAPGEAWSQNLMGAASPFGVDVPASQYTASPASGYVTGSENLPTGLRNIGPFEDPQSTQFGSPTVGDTQDTLTAPTRPNENAPFIEGRVDPLAGQQFAELGTSDVPLQQASQMEAANRLTFEQAQRLYGWTQDQYNQAYGLGPYSYPAGQDPAYLNPRSIPGVPDFYAPGYTAPPRGALGPDAYDTYLRTGRGGSTDTGAILRSYGWDGRSAGGTVGRTPPTDDASRQMLSPTNQAFADASAAGTDLEPTPIEPLGIIDWTTTPTGPEKSLMPTTTSRTTGTGTTPYSQEVGTATLPAAGSTPWVPGGTPATPGLTPTDVQPSEEGDAPIGPTGARLGLPEGGPLYPASTLASPVLTGLEENLGPASTSTAVPPATTSNLPFDLGGVPGFAVRNPPVLSGDLGPGTPFAPIPQGLPNVNLTGEPGPGTGPSAFPPRFDLAPADKPATPGLEDLPTYNAPMRGALIGPPGPDLTIPPADLMQPAPSEWNLEPSVPFRAPSPFQPLTGPQPGEPGFATQFQPNITPPFQQPSLEEIQRAFAPQFGPPAPPNVVRNAPAPASTPASTPAPAPAPAPAPQAPGGGEPVGPQTPAPAAPAAPAPAIAQPSAGAAFAGIETPTSPAGPQFAPGNQGLATGQIAAMLQQNPQLQQAVVRSAVQQNPAVAQLSPQQQQQLAAMQLGLYNQWAQILLNQGIDDPMHSPQWAQVVKLVNQQTTAAFGQTAQAA